MLKLEKTIDLSGFGWKDCSVTVQSITYGELKEFKKLSDEYDASDPVLTDKVLEIVRSKFVSGSGIDDKGEKVEIKAGQIDELPIEILLHIETQLFGGSPDPKS